MDQLRLGQSLSKLKSYGPFEDRLVRLFVQPRMSHRATCSEVTGYSTPTYASYVGGLGTGAEDDGDDGGTRPVLGRRSQADAGASTEAVARLRQRLAEEQLRLVAHEIGFVQLLDVLNKTGSDGPLSASLSRAATKVGRMGFASVASFDWQARLESALHDTELLHRISSEFVATAMLYGQIIVREKDLPDYEKSIKPVPLGGVAGGAKACASRRLFVFFVKVDIRSVYCVRCAV